MTTKTVANGLFKPELWAKELNRKINDVGVMKDCVNTKYEGLIQSQGDTVNIQTVGDVTIGDYTDASNITYQSLDGDTQKLVINQKKYFAFRVPDIDKVQANVEFMGKYTDQAKKQVVLVKDTHLLSKSADVPTANQLGAITISATNVYGHLVDLFTMLSDANAIDSNGKGADGKNPWLIVNPKVLGVIKKAPEATHATALADATIRKGTIVQIAGFDVKMSTNLKPVASASTILGGTTEAISYADQIIKVESLRDQNRFDDLVRGLYVYGSKTVQPTCLASAVVTIG